MARVSFSALVEEIVGKLAGSVFQYSYGGYQIHSKGKPRNPQTTYQQLRRGDFGFLSGSWRDLTPTQRQTFIDASSPGSAALNLYLQSNVNLTLIEEPTITDYVASTEPDLMPLEFTSVTDEVCLVKASGSVLVVPTDTKLLIYLTYLKQPTQLFTNPSQYSPVISFDEGTDLTNDVDIAAAFTARYGALKVDKLIGMKTVLIDKTNGLRGAESITSTITEQMPATFLQILQDLNNNTVTGTGAQTLFNYDVPANTMQNDGDRIEMHVMGAFNDTGVTQQVGFAISGTTALCNSYTNFARYVMKVTLFRVDSTHFKVVAEWYVNGQALDTADIGPGTCDWTTDFQLDVAINQGNDDIISTQRITVDWIKAAA